MTARHFYFTPIPCMTGALHAQPPHERLTRGTCWSFTPDFAHEVDLRAAIDAPDCIPTGSVRAQTHPNITLGIAHTRRERGAA